MLGLAAAGAVGLALLPTHASAALAPAANASADGSALSAYRTYMSALTAAEPAAAARAGQLVSGVENTKNCPGALRDLTKLSSDQLNESAVTAFGNEVDADLELAYVSAGSAPLSRFAATLDGLSWSTPVQFSTTTRLISGERALLGLAPSHICVDAIALDTVPLSEPTATRRFLARYDRVSAGLDADLSAFQALLAKFQTKSMSRVVGQINTLVSDYSAASSALEQSDADTILSDLGIDS